MIAAFPGRLIDEVNDMRRTKEWWATLEKWERIWLVHAEYWQNKGGGYGGGGYLPDDCSECSICGQAQLGSGACGACMEQMGRIIDKADEAMSSQLLSESHT